MNMISETEILDNYDIIYEKEVIIKDSNWDSGDEVMNEICDRLTPFASNFSKSPVYVKKVFDDCLSQEEKNPIPDVSIDDQFEDSSIGLSSIKNEDDFSCNKNWQSYMLDKSPLEFVYVPETVTRLTTKLPKKFENLLEFVCEICTFKSDLKGLLSKHIITDHIDGPDREIYIETCLHEGSYSCLLCDFNSYSSDEFTTHTKGHSLEKTESLHNSIDMSNYSKPHCQKKKAIYEISMKYECKVCEYTAYNKKQLNKHEKSHRKNHQACPNCTFTTVNRKEYKRHLNTHKTNRPFCCDLCEYRGRTKSALKQHQLSHEEPKYKCNYCTYKSYKSARVTRHERTHTGDKPFLCSFCGFRCNQEGTLVIHSRRHTGQRPYKCNKCSFAAISCSSLSLHKKKHNTKKKSFKCNNCHQVYFSQGSLKIHMRYHDDNGKSIAKIMSPKKGKEISYNKNYPSNLCNFKNEKLKKNSILNETHKTSIKKPKTLVHTCPTCRMEFSRRRALIVHLDSHLPAKNNKPLNNASGNIWIKFDNYVLAVEQ